MDNYLDLLQNVPEEEQPIFTCDCCGSCVYERIARKGVRYLE